MQRACSTRDPSPAPRPARRRARRRQARQDSSRPVRRDPARYGATRAGRPAMRTREARDRGARPTREGTRSAEGVEGASRAPARAGQNRAGTLAAGTRVLPARFATNAPPAVSPRMPRTPLPPPPVRLRDPRKAGPVSCAFARPPDPAACLAPAIDANPPVRPLAAGTVSERTAPPLRGRRAADTAPAPSCTPPLPVHGLQ